MAKVFLANAFSLSMLGAIPPAGLTLRVRPLTLEEARNLLQEGFESAVGHPSTAEVLSTLLGVEVPPNRVAVTLSPKDRVIVFQLRVRLEEGRILTMEEVKALYDQGLASFMEVVVDQ
jgi:hypothetical protein